MKKIFTVLFSICLAAAVQAQLLYQISGNGLEKPSYIVGTYHLAPSSFTDSIQGLRDVIKSCQQVYGELVQSEMLKPNIAAKAQQAMMLPEGMTLSKLFTPEEMTRIKDYANNLAGPLAGSVIVSQMEGMTPQAVSTTLEVLNYVKKSNSLDVANGIDLYLQQYATELGKEVGGLETVDFQLQTLFRSNTIERQKQLLLCMVDHPDIIDQIAELVIKYYFAQDLEGLKTAMDIKIGDACDSTPEEDARLIDNRNADWLTKMPAIMQDKSTLFAVGAAHLIGEKGVLNLLREAGYNVSPYPNKLP